MKKRKVIVTLEIETDAPLATMRHGHAWQISGDEPAYEFVVVQVQVNVVKPTKEPKDGGSDPVTRYAV